MVGFATVTVSATAFLQPLSRPQLRSRNGNRRTFQPHVCIGAGESVIRANGGRAATTTEKKVAATGRPTTGRYQRLCVCASHHFIRTITSVVEKVLQPSIEDPIPSGRFYGHSEGVSNETSDGPLQSTGTGWGFKLRYLAQSHTSSESFHISPNSVV